jgi:hypothetical protein
MFPILRTLTLMLNCMGIHTYFYHLNQDYPLFVDESLFLDTLQINMAMFTHIAYFLFSILDEQRADDDLKNSMNIEDDGQYKVFVKKTVDWLKDLSGDFELLRYVPIHDSIFYDCSGPLMQQVMLAFAMKAAYHKLFEEGGKAMMLNWFSHT